MEVSSVIDAMCHFQTQVLSYGEYTDLSPMAHELLHYLEECLEGKNQINGVISSDQLLPLASFGVKFDASPVFWKIVAQALSEHLPQSKPAEVLQIMTMMQESSSMEEGLLFECLDFLQANLSQISIDNLSFYLLVLTSELTETYWGK